MEVLQKLDTNECFSYLYEDCVVLKRTDNISNKKHKPNDDCDVSWCLEYAICRAKHVMSGSFEMH